MKLNVFIPHRWNNEDFDTISRLLDRTKYEIRDYSVPSTNPFDTIDKRYNVDPKIQIFHLANEMLCLMHHTLKVFDHVA